MTKDTQKPAGRTPAPGVRGQKNPPRRPNPTRPSPRGEAVSASPRATLTRPGAPPKRGPHPGPKASMPSRPAEEAGSAEVHIGAAKAETTVERLMRFGKDLAENDTSFAATRAKFLAQIVTIARLARRRRDVWTEICSAPFWEHRQRGRPMVENPERALLACFQLALNATEPAMLTAATRYAKALEDLAASDLEGPEIAKKIRAAGGIDGLLRAKKAAATRRWAILEISPEGSDQIAGFITGMPEGSEVNLWCRVVIAENDTRSLCYREITADVAP